MYSPFHFNSIAILSTLKAGRKYNVVAVSVSGIKSKFLSVHSAKTTEISHAQVFVFLFTRQYHHAHSLVLVFLDACQCVFFFKK